MKKFLLIIITLFLSLHILAQETGYTINDSLKRYLHKSYFAQIDTIEYWQYKISTDTKHHKNKKFKPLGFITFKRIVAINDTAYMELYHRPWQPQISFEIYNIKDSAYCKNESNTIMLISSCGYPNTGGDYIIVRDLIFLNTSVCVNCKSYDTGIDYCRPIINYILDNINTQNITSLSTLDDEVGEVVKRISEIEE